MYQDLLDIDGLVSDKPSIIKKNTKYNSMEPHINFFCVLHFKGKKSGPKNKLALEYYFLEFSLRP